MNVARRVAVALAVALAVTTVLPRSAAAEDPAPPAPPPADAAPRWTIGAGVGWTMVSYTSSLTPSLSTGFELPQGLLGASGSLERRIGARSWLVLGLSGSLSRTRETVPAGSYGMERRDLDALALTAGLRRPLTPAGAPLEVSIVVLAEGGTVHDAQRRTVYTVGAPQTTDLVENAWFAGANAGFAVERELARGLALRVATPLVEATYSRSRIRTNGQPAATARELSASAVIAPRLELRLAF